MRNKDYSKFDFINALWILSLVLIPLIYLIGISFLRRGDYGGIVLKATLDNYTQLFSMEYGALYLKAFGRSALLAAGTTFGCLVLGLPLAFFMAFKSKKLKNILIFLILIPFWTQFLIRIYAWMFILSDYGLSWLFTTRAVYLVSVYNYLPYMTLSLFLSMQKVDFQLLDAARDLGASTGRIVSQVLLPQIKGGLITGITFVFIPTLGEFAIPDLVGGGKSNYLGGLLTQQFLSARNWPLGAAMSVGFLLIVVLAWQRTGVSK